MEDLQNEPLVLASKSPVRASLLMDAGLAIDIEPAQIDERSVEDTVGSELDAADLSEILAQAKALDVSERRSDTLIIGADQVLECDGQIMHKAQNEDELRKKLLWLSGKTHTLHAGVAVVRNGEILWRHISQAHLTMRELSPEFVGRYMARSLPESLGSVGGYQLETVGAQLFSKIDGDYFTVLGLPLLPLLTWLRDQGVLVK